MAWSPDAARLASASSNSITIWDAQDGGCLSTLHHGEYVMSVAWSRDAARLASGATDGTVKIWNADSRECLLDFGPSKGVLSIAWAPDGAHLASGFAEGTVQIWDANDGHCLSVLDHDHDVLSVAWSPDGAKLASASADSIKIWTPRRKRPEWYRLEKTIQHRKRWIVTSVTWSHDSSRLVSTSDDNTVKIWDANISISGLSLFNFVQESNFDSVIWIPEVAWLVSTYRNGTAGISNLKSGHGLWTFKDERDWFRSAAWSPNAARLALGTSGGTIDIWDTTDLKSVEESVQSPACKPLPDILPGLDLKLARQIARDTRGSQDARDRIDPVKYLSKDFLDPKALLATMADTGSVISRSRALEYFVPGSASEESAWKFYTPGTLEGAWSMMHELQNNGVHWDKGVMQRILQFYRDCSEVSVEITDLEACRLRAIDRGTAEKLLESISGEERAFLERYLGAQFGDQSGTPWSTPGGLKLKRDHRRGIITAERTGKDRSINPGYEDGEVIRGKIRQDQREVQVCLTSMFNDRT